LAELLGGDLFLLESSVGKGSTFCLRIPLRNAQAYAEPLKEDTLSGLNSSLEKKAERGIDWKTLDLTSLLKGVRILLVEDSEDNQEIYAHFLRSAGAEVILAEDGEKAIESAFKYKPRLILMDIQIPKIDGKEATKTIRQRGFTAPIIALTAHALHDEIRSCLAAGCNGQITKPVAGELLVQEVYFYLNYRG
jgi:CheY-like chemotaxis protein